MAWLLTESDSTTQLISNAILMGQTSVSFESMSSIMQEKTHKKRSYGSLRTPPIPALPGFPRNPLHPILQYHPRVSSSYYEAIIFFFLMQGSTGSLITDPLYLLVFRPFSMAVANFHPYFYQTQL